MQPRGKSWPRCSSPALPNPCKRGFVLGLVFSKIPVKSNPDTGWEMATPPLGTGLAPITPTEPQPLPAACADPRTAR